MVEFAKTLGMGLLAVLFSPLLLVMFILYALYTIIVYLTHEVTSIVLFFFGKSFKLEDAETIALMEAKEEYAKRKTPSKEKQVVTYVIPQNAIPVTNIQETKEEDGDEDE